jgi:hypothetical protein
MISAQGRTLAGTGYREPMATLNFTYRRAITPQLALVVDVRDVFHSQKMETITDTQYLKQHTLTRYEGHTAFVGLSYHFGGVTGGGGQRREGREGRGPGGEGWRGGPPQGGPGGGDGGPGGGGGPGV